MLILKVIRTPLIWNNEFIINVQMHLDENLKAVHISIKINPNPMVKL
jgi:hypothetical protein